MVFAGQGDPRRSLSLLWRADAPPTRGGPGPRPRLSVDAIVAAAVALADEEGMGALSMRAVGDRLGRTAMALYTYVPGKSELLDLMYDAVHAELPRREPDPDDWRGALTAWAGEVLEFYVRHPWVLQVSQARPVLGPHEYAGLDTLVTLLRATGLPAGAVRRLVGTLFPFVRGSAQAVADARLAAAATGSFRRGVVGGALGGPAGAGPGLRGALPGGERPGGGGAGGAVPGKRSGGRRGGAVPGAGGARDVPGGARGAAGRHRGGARGPALTGVGTGLRAPGAEGFTAWAARSPHGRGRSCCRLRCTGPWCTSAGRS
ncbi:hypothetical protein SGRI78S_03903 [Streptomyces griseus subsp. griseus]